jgi:glycosyltransferase involved in cell wall biosynthesis
MSSETTSTSSEGVHFSIVMPIKNEEKSVKRALQTLVQVHNPQDEMEIIVVDGYSTDGSAYIVKKRTVKHRNITLLKNPKKLSCFRRPPVCVEWEDPSGGRRARSEKAVA